MAVDAASSWLAAFPRCGAGFIVPPSSESSMREPLSWPYDTELPWAPGGSTLRRFRFRTSTS